jgi:ketosteroid isomerase-like protein
MSEENVEIVHEAFDAWNAGDMDRMSEVFAPDTIGRPPRSWPEPGPFVGRDALLRQFRQQRETWDTDDLDFIGDFLTAGDRVLVRFAWKGAGHGPAMNMELTAVYTIRKGLIHEVEFFWDHAEALEAVGISE